jgi:hypothetical protein
MIRNNKLVWTLALILGLGASSAWAGAGVSIVAGASMGMPKFTPEQPTISGKIAVPTAGVLADFGGKVGLEVGALYTTDSFGSDLVKNTVKGIQFPVQVKFNLAPMINVGVGGFYAIAMDSCAEIGGVSVCSDPAESGNYGAMGSIGLNLGSFVASVRYLHGLKDLDPGAGETKMAGLQALVGYRFGFGR